MEIDGLQDTLFTALKASPIEKISSYIELKEDSHDDGTKPISPDELIIVSQQKFDLMNDRGEWAAATPKKDEILAMRAEIDGLKGQLSLTNKTKAAAGGEIDGGTKTTGKEFQKKDEAWKKVPPATGEPHIKKIRNKDFHWCVHHMAWTVHKPNECRLCPGATEAVPATSTPTAASSTEMSAKAILGRIKSAVEAASRY